MPFSFLVLTLLLMLTNLCSSVNAAEQSFETIIRGKNSLPFIVMNSLILPVQSLPPGSKNKDGFQLVGSIKKEKVSLFYNTIYPVKIGPNGIFSILIFAREKDFKFDLTVKDDQGMIETESFQVHYSNVKIDASTEKKNVSRFTLSPGLGITRLSYSETGTKDFSAWLTTGKFAVNYALSPMWGIGSNVFVNFSSLSTSQPGVSAQFFGINLRAIYTFQKIKEPWKLSAMMGWYTLSMSTSGSTFGFSNMSGPQVFVAGSRILNPNHSLNTYLKYSPSITGSIFSFTSCEVASGLSWAYLYDSRTYTLGLDWSHIGLTIKNTSISSSTTSF